MEVEQRGKKLIRKINKSKIQLIGVSEVKQKESGKKIKFEDIMALKFLEEL